MKGVVNPDLTLRAADGGLSEEQREVSRAVIAAVKQLPSGPRHAVILRYWHGLSYAEIARELRTQPSTVGVWLTRSLRKMSVPLSDFAP